MGIARDICDKFEQFFSWQGYQSWHLILHAPKTEEKHC